MSRILENCGEIIRVLFYANIIALIISFFYMSRNFAWFIIAMNIILIGSFMVIKKNYIIFDELIEKNKMAHQLNKGLNRLLGSS